MADMNRATASEQWTSVQAYTLGVICLLVGVAGGWLIRGSQAPAAASPQATSASVPTRMEGNTGAQAPTPEQMKRMADTQAAPLLEKLKSDPNNPELLTNIGNIYYDTQQYPRVLQEIAAVAAHSGWGPNRHGDRILVYG